MGTRGTIRIRKGGKQVVLYNHYDSYPSGLGVDFLTSIQNLIKKYGMDEFLQLIENVCIVSYYEEPTKEDIAKLAPYTDLTVGEQSTSSWYCLMRKLQGDLMGMLEAGYLLHMGDDMEEDFNYVLDLDHQCVFINPPSQDDKYYREASMALNPYRSYAPPPSDATPLSCIPELIKKWSKC